MLIRKLMKSTPSSFPGSQSVEEHIQAIQVQGLRENITTLQIKAYQQGNTSVLVRSGSETSDNVQSLHKYTPQALDEAFCGYIILLNNPNMIPQVSTGGGGGI